jgi:hypothetical protein
VAKESYLSESYRPPVEYTPAEHTSPRREITPEELPGEAYLAAIVALLGLLVVVFIAGVWVYILFVQ